MYASGANVEYTVWRTVKRGGGSGTPSAANGWKAETTKTVNSGTIDATRYVDVDEAFAIQLKGAGATARVWAAWIL